MKPSNVVAGAALALGVLAFAGTFAAWAAPPSGSSLNLQRDDRPVTRGQLDIQSSGQPFGSGNFTKE